MEQRQRNDDDITFFRALAALAIGGILGVAVMWAIVIRDDYPRVTLEQAMRGQAIARAADEAVRAGSVSDERIKRIMKYHGVHSAEHDLRTGDLYVERDGKRVRLFDPKERM